MGQEGEPAYELALNEEAASALARDVLESPLTPRFTDVGLSIRSDGAPWIARFSIPPEVVEATGGVYEPLGGTVEIDLIRGQLKSYNLSTRLHLAPPGGTASDAEMRDIAIRFARAFFPFIGDDPAQHQIDLSRINRNSQHRLVGFKVRDGSDQIGSVTISVRPSDGLVVGALGTWRPRLDAEIGIEAAAEAVLEFAAGADRFAGKEWAVTNSYREISDEPFAAYRIDIRETGADGEPTGLTYQFTVDALTGDVDDDYGFFSSEERHAEPGPKPQLAMFDGEPAWSASNGLVFVSERRKADRPYERGEHLFHTEVGAGSCAYLTSHSDHSFAAPSCAAEEDKLTLFSSGQIIWLSLDTGRWLLQSPSRRRVGPPAVAFDGSSVSYSALRRHGDRDIFVADIRRTETEDSNERRVVHLAGSDLHPVFSPDGSKVFFDHRLRREDGSEASSIRVARSDVPYWDVPAPEIVLGEVPRVNGLSGFPDGRLLVSHAEGLGILDPPARQLTPLELGELHDPDLPNGQPLEVRDPVVSPDGTKLAFSGLRWSGDPEDAAGWYIYVCNLDGSNLRRVTPLEDEPVPPYVFPETGKTAFDVAREIALERMNADR
ncbi:MAG: hypothetical protein ACOCX2_08630 [Armatimonadota bacterium]